MSKILLLVFTVAASSLLGCTVEDADEPEPPPMSSEPVDHSFTASDGVELHYVEYAGTGSPVVLLHGFLGSAQGNWIAPGISSALASRHRVVLLDQRGHGQSDKPKDASAYGERMLTDVIELLDHLDIPRAHIGGYSMGGAITIGLMRRAPDRFLTATIGAMGIEETDEALRAAAEAMDPEGTDPEEEKLLELAGAGDPPDPLVVEAIVTGHGTWWPPSIDLRAIEFPVFSIIGQFDKPYSTTSRLRRELPNLETVIVPGRTHLTTIIDPMLRDGISTFIDAHDAP
ncbi:alpha/beta hydrolase [Polyangium sp. y55x31]|uniref:alpha/beta fold hydrolase n=1 Tax=Polyangium sp. y55x31 TaxID=3042688 RepID=UPI002482A76B|nr:alpha/beta hydrolase [Polyangium sp. y55x31]MDI1482524.1 alpha/beta hydrolase [Polyangium sp. y55x31]